MKNLLHILICDKNMANPNLKENKFKRALVVPFRGLVKAISKTAYVKYQYKYITHHKLNLKDPVRYTEKLQYLRLFVYPKNELVNQCAGRAGVRKYLNKRGFADKLIPIYGVFDKFDDIDFNKLPNQFVMKCTHACAFNYICRDKSKINIPALRKQFNKWLKTKAPDLMVCFYCQFGQFAGKRIIIMIRQNAVGDDQILSVRTKSTSLF